MPAGVCRPFTGPGGCAPEQDAHGTQRTQDAQPHPLHTCQGWRWLTRACCTRMPSCGPSALYQVPGAPSMARSITLLGPPIHCCAPTMAARLAPLARLQAHLGLRGSRFAGTLAGLCKPWLPQTPLCSTLSSLQCRTQSCTTGWEASGTLCGTITRLATRCASQPLVLLNFVDGDHLC